MECLRRGQVALGGWRLLKKYEANKLPDLE